MESPKPSELRMPNGRIFKFETIECLFVHHFVATIRRIVKFTLVKAYGEILQ